MRTFLMVLVFGCCTITPLCAQQEPASLPTVTSFDCPKYPSKAESVHLQGTVELQVTTDGHQVAEVKVNSGHPLLVPEAMKNVKTWKFADHAPTTFVVRYYYDEGESKKDKNTKCAAKMEMPLKVIVTTRF